MLPQGLEKYSRDQGFDQNSVRDSGKLKISCRFSWALSQKAGFANILAQDTVMGKQTIFGVARDDRSSVYGIVLKKEKGAGMLEQAPPPPQKKNPNPNHPPASLLHSRF